MCYFWPMPALLLPNARRHVFGLLVAMALWGHAAHAQDTTTYAFDGIEVIATRIDMTSVGKHTDRLDSSVWKSMFLPSLANVLSLQTPLYVRAYGNGTLATLGMRGGSAAQTQVMWNGVPLRNPMIGLTDLALIPSGLIDRAAVHYGGHGAAFGSGAMGGLIDIGSSVRRDADYVEAGGSVGSWGTWMGSTRIDVGSARVRSSTRYVYQHSDNDYTYKLNADLPPRTQTHHALTHHALQQEMLVDLRKAGEIKGAFWYQYADRQIPPTSVQNVSRAAQQDENYRAMLQWRLPGAVWSWEGRAAFLDETIDYQDSLILLYTSNRFRTWLGEGSVSARIGAQAMVTGGVYAEHVLASSYNYLEDTRRGQQAVYTSARVRTGEWVWRLQLREERTDGVFSPLLWDAGASWSATPQLTVRSSVSRNYRVPTINDLVWRPGGNPDLVPEEGLSAEAGIALDRPAAEGRLQASVTGYVRRVDNWILWLPPTKDVRDYWSPVNIAEVRSQGLETRLAWSRNGKLMRWSVDAGLDLTWSRFEEDVPDLGIMTGDQMLYVPVENFQGGIRVGWRIVSLAYRHYWFGESPGINEQVESGNVGTANLGVALDRAPYALSAYVQVDNVWNVPYRLMERRPMPGRGVQVGLRLSWTGRKAHAAID